MTVRSAGAGLEPKEQRIQQKDTLYTFKSDSAESYSIENLL